MINQKRNVSKTLIRDWNNHIKWIKENSKIVEDPLLKSERIEKALSDYQYFVKTYFYHYVNVNDKFIPNAPFHNDIAYRLLNNENIFIAAKWSRGFSKSTTCSLFTVLWLIFNKKINHILIVSKTKEDSIRLLSHIQGELEQNQMLINDFSINGSFITDGDWSKSSIILNNYDVCINVIGRSQDPRGLRYKQFRIDYLIIDDLDSAELVMNPTRVEEAFNWLKESLLSTVNIKKFRFIFVENLYSKNSVFYKYLTEFKDIYISEVNALNEEGESNWPERFTTEELLYIKSNIGSISFGREYLNQPMITGSVFKNDYFQFGYVSVNSNDIVYMYLDPSWNNSKTSDYKAVAVMIKRGDYFYLVDMYLKRSSIDTLFFWIYDTYEKYTNMNCVVRCYMESSFAQSLIYTNIQTVSDIKGYRLPIIFDETKKTNKYSRIEISSVWYERKKVIYSNEIEDSPDVKRLIEQYLSFSVGSTFPDDGPDSIQSLIDKININTRIINNPPIFEVNYENIKF